MDSTKIIKLMIKNQILQLNTANFFTDVEIELKKKTKRTDL